MADMTSKERINTAIRLGKPDRVPVVPIIDFFASRYGGIDQHAMFFDVKKADAALEKTMNNLGRMDGQNLSYAGLGRIMQVIFPTPPILPGVRGQPDDAQFQFVEKSVVGPEEYRRIKERGPMRWMMDTMKMGLPEMETPLGLVKTLANAGIDVLKIRLSVRSWKKKDFESLVGINIVFTPMEYMSLFLRSFNDFILDLFRHGDDIKAASRALMGQMKMQGLGAVAATGVRRVFMGGTRTSASAISPKQFEEFALPEWQELCEFFVRLRITPILHYDSDWTPFFPLLKNLPRGKCVLNLDSTSDIFKAKEILGDHMCIMGDVPPTLLKLGEPEEVDDYCRRLIKELGADGGFILSSGCTVPIDSKPENVKAMLESVHKYGVYPIKG